jgi:hypothetical protein
MRYVASRSDLWPVVVYAPFVICVLRVCVVPQVDGSQNRLAEVSAFEMRILTIGTKVPDVRVPKNYEPRRRDAPTRAETEQKHAELTMRRVFFRRGWTSTISTRRLSKPGNRSSKGRLLAELLAQIRHLDVAQAGRSKLTFAPVL